MEITNGQDHAITLALDYYKRDKSSIIFEAGNSIKENGEHYFIGSFIAHIYRKGKFRFDCKFETWGNGQKIYSVEHKKI